MLNQEALLFEVIARLLCLTRWVISDLSMINDCESMAKLVCNSSLLKESDYSLKKVSMKYVLTVFWAVGKTFYTWRCSVLRMRK